MCLLFNGSSFSSSIWAGKTAFNFLNWSLVSGGAFIVIFFELVMGKDSLSWFIWTIFFVFSILFNIILYYLFFILSKTRNILVILNFHLLIYFFGIWTWSSNSKSLVYYGVNIFFGTLFMCMIATFTLNCGLLIIISTFWFFTIKSYKFCHFI